MEEGKEQAPIVKEEQNPEVETIALLTQFEPKFIRFVKGEMPEKFIEEYQTEKEKVAELVKFERDKVDQFLPKNTKDPQIIDKIKIYDTKSRSIDELTHDIAATQSNFNTVDDFLGWKNGEEFARKCVSIFTINHLIKVFKSCIKEIDGKQITNGKADLIDSVQCACGLLSSKYHEGEGYKLLAKIESNKNYIPVVIDENDLYRVLYQFIRNAEKEWTTNGLNAEKDCKINIKIEERENDVAIIIKDNVGGIDIQKLRDKLGARAYDMTDDQVAETIFERGVSTNSSGLGLSIAAKFVEENGGSIKLRPKVGEGEDAGAEFTILLKKAD